MSRGAVGMSRGGERPSVVNAAVNERPATPADLPGAFFQGKRILTPSGKPLPRSRPISQLATRLRGVCTMSREDQDISTSPISVSCGSPTLARQQLCSRGRAVSTPPGTFNRTHVSKLQSPIAIPRLAKMEAFLRDAAKLTSRSHPFQLKTSDKCTPESIREIFGVDNHNSSSSTISTVPGTGSSSLSTTTAAAGSRLHQDLHTTWQNKVLQSGLGPQCDPSVICGIENITEQEQLPRAATLLHALLTFGGRIEAGEYPVVTEDRELVNLQPLHRLSRHTRIAGHLPGSGFQQQQQKRIPSFSSSTRKPNPATSSTAAPTAQPIIERLHYHEGARHIIVARNDNLYRMDALDEAGRVLESSELVKGFRSIVEEDITQPPNCGLNLTRLTFLELQEFMKMKNEISTECKSNELCFQELESALLFVELSSNGAETAEDPTLAIPHRAWYHGNTCSLHVYPNGNAVLRVSALTLDAPLLNAVASQISHDANCDPMLEYVPDQPVVVQATTLVKRAPTPVVGKKPPKGPKGHEPQEETVVQEVAVTIPGTAPPKGPERLPLWMPGKYCSNKVVPTELAKPHVVNFTVQVKHEASLHTALILALKHLNPQVEFPLLHVLKHAAVRDPSLQLCVTNDMESALRHLSAFSTPCGPLRTEVERCCGNAVRSLTSLLKDGTPHVSNFATLLQRGLLSQSAHNQDTLEGELMGHADLHVCKMPYNSDVMWTVRSPLWAEPSQRAAVEPPALVNYTLVPAGRSSLRTALGALCNCTLVVPGHGASSSAVTPETAEDFVSATKQFVKFVDACADKPSTAKSSLGAKTLF